MDGFFKNYIRFLSTAFQEFLKLNRSKTLYHIAAIKSCPQSLEAIVVLTVKTSRHSFEKKLDDLLSDKDLLQKLDPSSIQKIASLTKKNPTPEYSIAAKKLSDHVRGFTFKIKATKTGDLEELSLQDIYRRKLIHKFDSQDAHELGYLSALQETTREHTGLKEIQEPTASTAMDPTPRFKFSYLLLGLYITCLLLTVSLANRFTSVGFFLEPGGIFVFPIIFPICDIAAEVYGYAYPRLFIWIGAFCELFFAIAATLVSHLPHPGYFLHAAAYQAVFDPTIRFVLSSLIGTLIGEFLTIYLLTRWKIEFKGKFFAARMIASSAIGQLVLSAVVDILAFGGKLYTPQLTLLIFSGFLWKMAYIIPLAFPCWLVVKYLKRVEQTDFYDINTNFTPFKLALA